MDGYRPRVCDLPRDLRPVSRLRDCGPGVLATTELLAAVLQTPDALRQATELLTKYKSLKGLVNICEQEIEQIDGIGPAGAARLKAALEIGRRLMIAAPDDKMVVRAPADVAQMLMAELSHREQEHMVAVLVDTRQRVLGMHTVYIGTSNQIHIEARDLFREAIRRNATAVICAHNHPSGDPTHSPNDVAVTIQLVASGKVLDIEVLDHIIIGDNRFVSLRERGLGFDS